MSKTNALKILDNWVLEHAQIGVIDDESWADNIGRVLIDSGRKVWVQGWGHMTGCLRVLTDDCGRDAYLIH